MDEDGAWGEAGHRSLLKPLSALPPKPPSSESTDTLAPWIRARAGQEGRARAGGCWQVLAGRSPCPFHSPLCPAASLRESRPHGSPGELGR